MTRLKKDSDRNVLYTVGNTIFSAFPMINLVLFFTPGQSSYVRNKNGG